jgi:hypothetical protein
VVSVNGYLGYHLCSYVMFHFCAAIWCEVGVTFLILHCAAIWCGVGVAVKILDYGFLCVYVCHLYEGCFLVK